MTKYAFQTFWLKYKDQTNDPTLDFDSFLEKVNEGIEIEYSGTDEKTARSADKIDYFGYDVRKGITLIFSDGQGMPIKATRDFTTYIGVNDKLIVNSYLVEYEGEDIYNQWLENPFLFLLVDNSCVYRRDLQNPNCDNSPVYAEGVTLLQTLAWDMMDMPPILANVVIGQ